MKVNIIKDLNEEKKKLMDEFIEEATKKINEHLETTKVITIGKFFIKV